MQKITPFLSFNNQAEEAVSLYVSLFKNSKILSVSRIGEGAPGQKGSVMTMGFQIEGQEFTAMNGGPQFSFANGISLFVSCETQAEVDTLWDKLSEGGEKGQCGWLKDRFGVWWQIIPIALGELLGDKDPRKAQTVLHAMLKMQKIDIAGLRRAYEQE